MAPQPAPTFDPRQRARVPWVLVVAVLAALAATAIGLVLLWPSGAPAGGPVDTQELAQGIVTVTREVPCGGGESPGPDPEAGPCLVVSVRLTSGPERGQSTVFDVIGGPGQPELQAGDRIVLNRSVEDVPPDPETGAAPVEGATEVSYFFADFQRRTPLLWLAGLFALVVVGVGRLRGLTAILGVAVTFGLLVEFVLPAILAGESPLAVAVVGASASMFVILYLAHGISAKTTAALLGTLASLAITGGLAAVFVDMASLFNQGAEEVAFLQVNASQVDLQGLLLGGIIIGSLGVLNDVTVTQASAVWALREADSDAGFGALYRRAMQVGRDHIASTVDTLVLAYAGASLPLLLLFSLSAQPVGDLVTGSFVAEEVVRTLVGGIGLAASVPITTALAALVASRRRVPTDDDWLEPALSGGPAEEGEDPPAGLDH